MTAASANSTTTGVLPANTYLRVLGDSLVTITRDGRFVASQSTARDNFVGPYPLDSNYSVVAGDAAIDIKVTGEEGPTEARVPAMLSTDANGNTVLVGGDGVELLSIDPLGVLLANIIPRRDTLVNLLDDTAGGVGEISEATDWDALVLHNGVVGGARILYCKPKAVQVVAFAPQALTSGDVTTPLSFFQAVSGFENTDVWASGAPTVFAVPSGANRVRITANVGFAANATGTRQLLATSQTGVNIITLAQKSPHATLPTYLSASGIAALTSETQVKLVAVQASGGALNTESVPFTRATVEFWRA